jgi:hypothetical protein
MINVYFGNLWQLCMYFYCHNQPFFISFNFVATSFMVEYHMFKLKQEVLQ